MGSVLEAIILGIVQGLTEFLPVSSSGHLEIMKVILGDEAAGLQSLFMTVVLHFATALSTIYVFREEIRDLLQKAFSSNSSESRNYILKIIISIVPAAGVGLLFDEVVAAMFDHQLILVGMALLVTALLLILADREKFANKEVTYGTALVIGIAQAIAIIPGISRSGATISTSVLLRIDRDRAARFSFLMVVPLIFGKVANDLIYGVWIGSENLLELVSGFVAAFITGAIACTWMIRLVRQAKLSYFGWYCILVGSLTIAYVMGVFSNG